MRKRPALHPLALATVLCFAGSALAAEVYKWTDENGVVNYSNTAPAKTKKGKEATVVEDRVSVYSADPAVTEAVRSARERRTAAPPPGASFTPQGQAAAPARTYSPPPAPPQTAYDPCSVPNDPNCIGYPAYGGAPYYRHRPPHLNQPQLPPGAIAGNVNAGAGFIPGQSTQAPAQLPAAQPRASFTLREDEPRGGGRRSR
jgi:hypothetical protein